MEAQKRTDYTNDLRTKTLQTTLLYTSQKRRAHWSMTQLLNILVKLKMKMFPPLTLRRFANSIWMLFVLISCETIDLTTTGDLDDVSLESNTYFVSVYYEVDNFHHLYFLTKF